MNWVPKFLEPFDVNIAAMVAIWYVAVALSLHRITRYWLRVRRLDRFGQGVQQLALWFQHGRGVVGRDSDDGTLVKLFSAVRYDTSPEAPDRFARSWLSAEHRVDRWNNRLLDLMNKLAPMFGLACTVAGVLGAFTQLGTHTTATLQDIGGPVGLALRSTFLGVLCACFCSVVLKSAPLSELHQREMEEVEVAWSKLLPIAKLKKVEESTGTDRSVQTAPGRRPVENLPDAPNCPGKGPQCQD